MFAWRCFELGKHLFDRIEVGAVWRQIAQRRAGSLDCLPDTRDFVRWQIVHDDNIALAQRWRRHSIAVDRDPARRRRNFRKRDPTGQHAVVRLRIIVVADTVMSLDNMMAVAAAAKGFKLLILLGLALSIPFIVFGSTLLLPLFNRFHPSFGPVRPCSAGSPAISSASSAFHI